MEFICCQDGAGAAIVAPSSKPVKLRLSDGEWAVMAFIAFPNPYYDPNRPPSAHFFAFLEPTSLSATLKENFQRVQLPPNQVHEISLFAVAKGNFAVFRPEVLRPELSEQ